MFKLVKRLFRSTSSVLGRLFDEVWAGLSLLTCGGWAPPLGRPAGEAAVARPCVAPSVASATCSPGPIAA
jgi:hypothetical protein